ncbi:Pentatricopeptide repeat-containing protein At5g46680 [Linum perenne]
MKSKGFTDDGYGYCTVMGALLKVGKVEDAARIEEEMVNDGIEYDLVSYNTVMNLLYKQGKVDDAYSLMDEIKMKGFEGDKYTYTIIVDGECKAGNIEGAQRCLTIMNKMGFDSTLAATNSVIDRLARVGNHELALEMFESMEVRDSYTYSSLIYHLSKARKFQCACALLFSCVREEMKILSAAKQAFFNGLQNAGFQAEARILRRKIQFLQIRKS